MLKIKKTLISVEDQETLDLPFRGQGACNFFQWDDDARNEPSVDHLGEREPLSSSLSTGNGEKTNPYPVVDVDDDDGVDNASLDDKLSESPSSVGCELKEMLVVDVDAENNVLPILRPDFSWIEDKKRCFGCGLEGHWMKDCINANSICVNCEKFGHWKKDCIKANSICVKCGKFGHWKKDCTA
ncbi:hypothetical protein Syun_014155 [Stephania yunnanensis]|uniref:CCHC-type domain-containing protein n=1 Tax=Stephania yunnanensis TaxID=152371 RepID=A0AAP0JJK3_9MAGN